MWEYQRALVQDSLENYDIGQLLGRGGFASVYRAYHRRSRQEIAIKIINKMKIHEMNINHRVQNEILLHIPLEHENIVHAWHAFEDEENIYIVMELCSGGNLYKLLKKRGKMSESEAVAVIRQLLQALEYLHSNNIIHRDLKLSNILLVTDAASSGGDHLDRQSLRIKVCDFGLAIQLTHPDEEHFTLCGTPNYIAPEVASQQNHGYPADLWSVGCLFYSMVVGTPPFEQNNVHDTLQSIIKGEFKQPKPEEGGLSHTGRDFIECLLQLVRVLTTVKQL